MANEKDGSQKLEFLKKLPIFQEMGKADLMSIACYMNKIVFFRDQEIYKKGDQSNFVYILIKGILKTVDS